MDTAQIKAYGNYSEKSTAPADQSSKAKVDTTQFMKLLATQLSNQDALNPMQDTQFISQMAQFTALQNSENLYNNSMQQLESIQVLMGLSYMQFGAALVGKTVEVAIVDSNGQLQKAQGVVSSVNYSKDIYTVKIDGKDYPITSVMQVVTPSK